MSLWSLGLDAFLEPDMFDYFDGFNGLINLNKNLTQFRF
jgi:hypothetical protein